MKTTKRQLPKSVILGLATILLPIAAQATSDSPQHIKKLYDENCASCHGSDHGGFIAPALNSETLKGRSPTALRSLIMTGSFDTLMPPFFGRLSDDEIRGLVKHLQTTPKSKRLSRFMLKMKASCPLNLSTISITWII
jgi:mono/diheme cytochrome c family protein